MKTELTDLTEKGESVVTVIDGVREEAATVMAQKPPELMLSIGVDPVSLALERNLQRCKTQGTIRTEDFHTRPKELNETDYQKALDFWKRMCPPQTRTYCAVLMLFLQSMVKTA